MEVKIERDVFAKALGQLVGVVPTRSPRPVLMNILLEAESNRLTATATDMEVSLVIALDAEVIQPGKALVNATLLRGVVVESTSEHLYLTAEKSSMKVQSGDEAEFKLPMTAAEEFPAVPAKEPATLWVVSGKDLRSILEGTRFATDSDNTRYALNGCLLEVSGDKLISVATDGRRMAVAECKCVAFGEHAFPPSVVVPTKGVAVIQRLAADTENDCQVFVDGNEICVVAGFSRLHVRLVEGRFPKWRDVLPSPPVKILVIAGDLRSAVKRAMLFATQESAGVSLDFHERKLLVSKIEKEKGQGMSMIPIDYEGERITVQLDGRFVVECLGASGASSIAVGLTDDESAVLFSAESWRCVVMPMAKN